MKKLLLFTAYCLLVTVFTSCLGTGEEEVITPKPRAFYSLTFPEKKYKLYDVDCPFSFETPVYSSVEPDMQKNAEPCWINIKYPLFKAQLHVSYKEVKNNLPQFLDEARELAIRHQVKATGLDQQPILRDSAKVYGLFYDIGGNTASSIQFYVTDSTRHFLRGSLYFNCAPNIDSMKIVIDFLREDILHMVQTFKWKEVSVNRKQ
ncbi:MAG: gliding motility lipoprotein GldD [Bacteroidia bacterium]